MTVCIASISGASGPKSRIVAISDMKASTEQGSNEMASIKSRWVLPEWMALFAGNDISPCIPICNAVTKRMDGMENTVEAVTQVFAAEYQRYLSNLADPA